MQYYIIYVVESITCLTSSLGQLTRQLRLLPQLLMVKYGEEKRKERWLNPLFKIGFKNQLTTADICDGLPEHGAGRLCEQLDRVWQKEWKESESQKKSPRRSKDNPAIFDWTNNWIFPARQRADQCRGLYICSMPWSVYIPTILKISSLSLHKTTSGQIVNLMSTDVDKLSNAVETFNFAWVAPIEIGVVLYLMYRQIGVAAFFTMIVVVSVVPLQFFMGWWFGKLRTRIGAKSDKRIHMMNEIIAGMRVIKMYCWEKPFSDLISKLRRDEIIEIWKATMAKAINISIYLSVPRLLCIVVFTAAWKLEVPLTMQLIYSTIGWIEALRLTRVLVLDEMNEPTNEVHGLRITSDNDSIIAMAITDMTACWRVQQKTTDNNTTPEKNKLLQNNGELIAVIGPVGAGKTSLLLTLLGELPSSEGSIVVNGTLGYISQQPWVVSGTLQENILFGCDYDADKYKHVIEACALNKNIVDLYPTTFYTYHCQITVDGENMVKKKEKKGFSGECPYARANFLSKAYILVRWLNPLFKIGFKNQLTTADICDGLPEHGAEQLCEHLDRVWQKEWKESESQKKSPRRSKDNPAIFDWTNNWIFPARQRADQCRGLYICSMPWSVYIPTSKRRKLTDVTLQQRKEELFCSCFFPLFFQPSSKFLKAINILKISSLSLHKTTSGQIVNLMSTDVDKLSNAVETFNFAWVAPIEIGVVLYLMYRQIGVAAFFTMIVVVSVVPLQFFMGWWFGKLRTRIGAKSDKRIHMMNEIIAGMRVIKMYCWEKPFSDLISKLRRDEIIEIWKATMAKAINISIYLSVPRLLCIVVFTAAWKLEVPLTMQLIYSTIGWIEALRLTRVLVLDEMNEPTNEVHGLRITSDNDSSIAMAITDMTACWRVQQKTTDNNTTPEKNKLLQIVSLAEVKGELIAVIGPVGAGKTSLLLTLLGELPSSEGSIVVNGTLGYISQQPWVVSGTLQENILFGCDYDVDKYKHVIEACALNKRGLLLSGGQKARLTLGRTIYRDADIYLLDDPLSAVDTEVGHHLFNKCICKYLKGKTRILVTHQLQYLKAVDRIIVLKEKGTELSTLISAGHSDKDVQIVTEIEGDKYEGIIKAETPQEKAEDIMSGRVSLYVYWSYLAAGYPVIFVPLLLILNFATQEGLCMIQPCFKDKAETHDLISSYFKSHDNSSSYIQNHSAPCQHNCTPISVSSLPQYQLGNMTSLPMMPQYNTVDMVTLSVVLYHGKERNEANAAIEYHWYRYIIVGVCYIVLTLIMSKAFFTMNVLASKRLHDRMFKFVLGAKTRFFDSNPVVSRRILNRFARDIGHMDDMLPRIFYCVFEIGLRLAFLTGTTCVINPWLILPLLPIIIVVFLIRYYAIQTTRDMKRIEAKTFMQGEEYQYSYFHAEIDDRSPVYSHVSDTLIGLQSIRALKLNTEFVKSFDDHVNRHTISWFLYLTTYRWFSVRSLFAVMTSVERVTAYTKVEQESTEKGDNPPPESWPQKADIKFIDICLKYSPDSPMILKNINCSIRDKEKLVGQVLVKVLFLASLFRLAEPEGRLLIDDIDVLHIGLHELRRKISVIPQDPVLFSGNLRRNLDPFDEYNDDQLWKSLEQVQMKEKVEGVPGKLYMEMAESGHNFSVGQRQLICLARAILDITKFWCWMKQQLMTDELIQQTIRTRFSDCTVLTVAHRLHTIMDSDRVMVLDQGELKEFDHPHKLLQNENSYFKKLVEQTGKGQSELLHKMAADAYAKHNSSLDGDSIP
ncbi:hypothetical protein KUTeg_017643 [Tegillarca granosa]|uniref:Uncharacterized protein n=1 Tax=Tegillarca granosa TaxID=220873 RepID=A0ABQ9EKK4_TEGGR|nr:hypothetical protein KUTeg_017643 [Tegillarca granosa]